MARHILADTKNYVQKRALLPSRKDTECLWRWRQEGFAVLPARSRSVTAMPLEELRA